MEPFIQPVPFPELIEELRGLYPTPKTDLTIATEMAQQVYLEYLKFWKEEMEKCKDPQYFFKHYYHGHLPKRN